MTWLRKRRAKTKAEESKFWEFLNRAQRLLEEGRLTDGKNVLEIANQIRIDLGVKDEHHCIQELRDRYQELKLEADRKEITDILDRVEREGELTKVDKILRKVEARDTSDLPNLQERIQKLRKQYQVDVKKLRENYQVEGIEREKHIQKLRKQAEEQKQRYQAEEQKQLEEQNLKTLLDALPEIHVGMTVPLSTIQSRILSVIADEDETERLLLLLQKVGTLPGRYDRITQTFKRTDESPSVKTSKSATQISKLNLTCRYCGGFLSEKAGSCPDCRQRVSSCPICQRNINFGELVGLCPSCLAAFHETHLTEWLKVQGKCPVCQTEFSRSEIIRQDLGKKKVVRK